MRVTEQMKKIPRCTSACGEKIRDKGQDNKCGENRWSIEARYMPSDSDVEM